jgi:hypothetical protein
MDANVFSPQRHREHRGSLSPAVLCDLCVSVVKREVVKALNK